MSDVWQRVDAWLNNKRRVGKWRQRAVTVMKREVEAYRNVHVDIDADELMKLVDAAYPFGPRSHHPYDAWLAERKILRATLGLANGEAVLPAPTDDDYAACEVAVDLVEQEQVYAATALLDEQAPRRLNRACPVCGVKVGERCIASLADKWIDPGQINYRVVPHLSRVMPRRVNGPLFGGSI